MNKKKNIRLVLSGWIISFAILLGGCTDDFSKDNPVNAQRVSISLNLSTPGLNHYTTKAMDKAQESAIDASLIQILIFQEVGAEEQFRYQATITNRQLPQVTIEVPLGSTDDRYRLVVLANAAAQYIAPGTTKADALADFMFDCTGKWNASSTAPSKIPMWGELNDLIPITHDRSVAILLHRALARVDVGLRFDFNNPVSVDPDTLDPETDTESVLGLDNFKIRNISVYRTRNKAYVATLSSNVMDNKVVTPLIPSTANFNNGDWPTLAEADQNPLFYDMMEGVDSCIREIYIPESVILSGQSNMDNVPCLVIGGLFGADNNSNITYYRADFAVYNNGTVDSYKPILRNHRYIFDIKSVSSPGLATPEQALKSISAPLQLDVLDWNEVPLNYNVRGNYFLQVKEREIWMEARAQQAGANTYEIPYQTDLELDGSAGNGFTYTWKSSNNSSSELFALDIDYTNKIFIFTALSDNISAGSVPRADTITLMVEDMKLDIIVNQRASNVTYDIVCDSVIVNGLYREGVPLNYANYIRLTVRANGSLDGKGYEIRTIEKNGIHFIAEGTFSGPGQVDGTYNNYTVQLEGFGTPVNDDGSDVLKSFDVDIVSNSQSGAACTARIIIAYRTKRILTIGANAGYHYGYMLEDNSASRAFVDAAVNFGTMPNSTVPMEENASANAFTIKVMTAGDGMTGEWINYNDLLTNLNTFKPDIILTGQAINYFDYPNITSGANNVIKLLAQFVQNKGVLIMCNEYYPYTASINAMVGEIMESTLSGNSVAITDLLFSMASIDDPITNGPFGDMRNKFWGADGTIMFGFSNLPEGKYTTYSKRKDGYVCMFRHTEKPFFYMGEGGFISNYQLYIGNAFQGSNIYFPFAIDSSYRPISRINYAPGNSEVFNSQIFGNILAWAVDYSEENGIEYVDGENKFQ